MANPERQAVDQRLPGVGKWGDNEEGQLIGVRFPFKVSKNTLKSEQSHRCTVL